jgi:AcrR family transcriptional regulator
MAPRRTREEWIVGSFTALCEGGIDAVRVEPLARSLGVTKGSFYHHFANRRELHLGMLAEWERLGTSMIIDTVDEGASDPEERLRLLMFSTYGIDEVADAIEAAIRAWASGDEVAAEAVRRVDDRRVGYVAALLVDAGFTPAKAARRARLMYRHLIGEFIWRTSGGPASTKQELNEMAALLLVR